MREEDDADVTARSSLASKTRNAKPDSAATMSAIPNVTTLCCGAAQ